MFDNTPQWPKIEHSHSAERRSERLAHAPGNLLATTLARHNDRADALLDRYQRWRRETWWRNEMGDKQSHFKAAEEFRR